jgi:hypothetical protein
MVHRESSDLLAWTFNVQQEDNMEKLGAGLRDGLNCHWYWSTFTYILRSGIGKRYVEFEMRIRMAYSHAFWLLSEINKYWRFGGYSCSLPWLD